MPIWTFDRMGATRTKLPDGRLIRVGGEHEDWYDPDFHIYNDVVVLGPGDHVAIYGYPKEIFPPTDFHTATLVNGQIILIGALGYPDDRRPGHTPVYSLNTSNYRITEIQTTGESPGWVFKHQLTADKDGVITLRDGEVWEPRNGEPRFRRNFDDYSFDTRSGVWQRLTHRNWHQFRVRLEDGDWFPMESSIKPEDLFPEPCSGAEFLGVSDEHPGQGVFRMEHFLVIITFGHQDVEVVVHDNVPVEKAARLAEVVRAKAEQLIGKPLALDKVS